MHISAAHPLVISGAAMSKMNSTGSSSARALQTLTVHFSDEKNGLGSEHKIGRHMGTQQPMM
jgi:hypothetical protein